jgi:hypothetical protein
MTRHDSIGGIGECPIEIEERKWPGVGVDGNIIVEEWEFQRGHRASLRGG